MKSLSFIIAALIFPATIFSKDPELPLCPPQIQYFPQNLPMHCRMPTIQDFPNMPPMPPNLFGPPPGKLPDSNPIPSGGPGPMPPGLGQGSISGPMPIPMPMAMPMQMPMAPGPAHKLPIVVMPFYSPDKSFKEKHEISHRSQRHYPIPEDSSDTETDTDGSTNSSDEYKGWWRRSNAVNRPHHRHHQKSKRKKHRHVKDLLTPVLQYVTKDGYVIYEKQISKGEASDWMHLRNGRENEEKPQHASEEQDSNEERQSKIDIKNMIVKKKNEEAQTEKNIKRYSKKVQKNILSKS